MGGPRRSVAMASRLPFEEVHLVGEEGFTIAEEGNDDAKADRGLCSGVGDDEEGKDLSGNVPEVTRKGDEVDVDGIQDQLDGHQDDDHVAARDDSDGTDQEERETEEQVMADGHHASVLFLAMTTAPTMATSNRTLAISKGRR